MNSDSPFGFGDVVAAAKILKTTNVVLKAFSPLIYRKPLRLYIPIYLIGLQQGHEPEAIDFVLAALHAHIGVLQWAEEKTAANGGLHMLKWN
mmetsp:Transcript_27432/g.49633  ORF Transcript_27432/g.49633 Transcript_27432/m.49633 type:complete len:92 (+) Transcript_27432:7160-7435(+)|eukprot:CAMPEP_0202487868 /NCGR_PEP_ID=MMETSP1361-20130828/6061_1 /ASSEMBLY_ACC=CAM_ASM_000849 /TAXON_ID=210615 /ORGANISM="Staurosira complex sp., Strain CCMP2646" /LENGTH=91 /DNA_ID=CAMNT_0049117327 /DNA_START=115 /DNA_END=390 /DNA_ORIENTATION=-